MNYPYSTSPHPAYSPNIYVQYCKYFIPVASVKYPGFEIFLGWIAESTENVGERDFLTTGNFNVPITSYALSTLKS